MTDIYTLAIPVPRVCAQGYTSDDVEELLGVFSPLFGIEYPWDETSCIDHGPIFHKDVVVAFIRRVLNECQFPSFPGPYYD